MATVTVQQTFFSSAAAALNPSNAAVERDAEEIYQIAVWKVRQKPEHCTLAQDLVDRITNARTIEELTQRSGTDLSNNRFWRDSPAWRRLGTAVGGFDRFKDPIGIYAQANPSIILPIYASVCVIATIAREVLGAHESLVTFVDRVKNFNDQYNTYILGQGFDKPLRDALTKFYETIIQFCLLAVSLLVRSKAATIIRSVIKSVNAPFDRFLQELADTRIQVDSNVTSKTSRDVKDIKRTLAQPQYLLTRVYSTAPGAQAPIGVPDLLSQNFTGRTSYLRDIHRVLTAASNVGPAKIAIWGAPGIGKTQLTLRYLHLHNEDYRRVIFINASSKDSIILAYRTIASTLNLADIGLASNDLVIEKVRHWLAENDRWLLIFDNVKISSEILQLTPTVGQGHILFSTRDLVAAATLARPDGCFEIVPLSPEESAELTLDIINVAHPRSDQDVAAAKAVAEFTGGLPLAVEQLARLSQSKRLNLSDTLSIVKRKAEILRLNHPASIHERNLSCGALLIEALNDIGTKNEGAAALFKLLVYLEPSRIPMEILFDAPSRLRVHFARQDTYTCGTINKTTKVSQPPISKQKFRLDDYDPFDLTSYKRLLGIGQYNKKYSNVRLPRIDSDEDQQLKRYWTSCTALKGVFADNTTIDHSLNILAEAGLIRRLHQSHSVWIHDLFAEMGTAVDQENGSSANYITAHLASTLVYLTFPIPQVPVPFHVLDRCLLLLPSALRSHNFLFEAGILNNITVGAELNHLIASTIHGRGLMMATLHFGSLTEAIKFYKLALLGYVCAYNRLKNFQNVSPTQTVLATVADYSEEDLYRRYLPRRWLRDYERFGRSAPWRALQTALKLSILLMENGKLDESLLYVNTGVCIAKEIFGTGHQEHIHALGLLLQVRESRKEWRDAYDVALNRAKAYKDYTGAGLEDDNNGATLATDLGNAAKRLGKRKEAERWFEFSLNGISKTFGQNSPEAEVARRKLDEFHDQNGS